MEWKDIFIFLGRSRQLAGRAFRSKSSPSFVGLWAFRCNP
jgi:hypothetical protein